MKKSLWLLMLVLGLFAAPQSAQAQCPMCKAAVTTGSNYGAKESKLVGGLNTGILYLFLLPYSSLMLLGVVIAYNYRKNKKANAPELSTVTVNDVIGDHQVGGNPAS